MKYLKKFTNTSDYDAFKVGESYILPNVSYVESNNEVLFNSYITLGADAFKAKFVTKSNNVNLFNNENHITDLVIDGERIKTHPSFSYAETTILSTDISLTKVDGNITGTVNKDCLFNTSMGIKEMIIKPIDDNIDVTSKTILCVVSLMGQYNEMSLTEAYYTYDITNNSIVINDNFCEELNAVLKLFGMPSCDFTIIICDILENGEIIVYDSDYKIDGTLPEDVIENTITCLASEIKIAIDDYGGIVTAPSEYFVNNPSSFKLKPLDSNLDIENAYICCLFNAPELGGIVGDSLPIMAALEIGFCTYNEIENSITATNVFLQALQSEMPYPFCAVLATVNEETDEPTFYDTINESLTSDALYSYTLKGPDEYSVEFKIDSNRMNRIFNESILKEITIPNTINEISHFCFYANNTIEKIVLPNTIDAIDNNFFYCCNSLKEIFVPESVTYIGKFAFQSCTSLETFIMPDSVTDISHCVFQNCTSLKEIKLSENITSLNGDPHDVGGFFCNCTSLKSITLPKNINVIEKDCFRGCSSLTSIRCESTTAPYFDKTTTFLSIPSTGTLYYPEGSDYSTWIAELPSGWTYVEF